jgi:hypothetical protein
MMGLYFDLDRRGFNVFVDPDQFSSLRYGKWREATPNDVDALVMIIDLPDVYLGKWLPPPGSRLIASSNKPGAGYAVFATPPPMA